MQNVLTLETNKYLIKIENFEGPLDLLCHLIAMSCNYFQLHILLSFSYYTILKNMPHIQYDT